MLPTCLTPGGYDDHLGKTVDLPNLPRALSLQVTAEHGALVRTFGPRVVDLPEHLAGDDTAQDQPLQALHRRPILRAFTAAALAFSTAPAAVAVRQLA